MSNSQSHPAAAEVTFGTYHVRPGCEKQFEQTIPRSWLTLRKLGFIEDEQPILYRSVETPVVYVEQTRWRPGVMDPAHDHPDVIPIWDELAKLVEPRTLPAADRGLTFAEFVSVSVAASVAA